MKPKIFGLLDKAANKALDRHNQVLGFQSDPALAQYEQLKDADFENLIQTYGQDAVTQYVTVMESRKMKGG